jgi:hypothetical protein
MVPHFRDETFGDIKTPEYNVWVHIVWGLSMRGHNVQGYIIPDRFYAYFPFQ